MSSVPADRIHATLYQADGLSKIAWLRYARDVSWREELSKPGSASFSIPLNDPATVHCEDRRIVKLTWMHRGYPIYTFAVRLQGDAGSYAVDGRKWLRFEQQPGLLGMLGDAAVYPEYGLHRRSSPTRTFGPMSVDGNWRLDHEWRRPQGYAFTSEKGYRKDRPPFLKAYDPDWIAYTNPRTHVSPETVNYYRTDVDIPKGLYAKLVVAADNFLTVWLDGEEIISPDYSDPLGWQHVQSVPLHLAAGTRQLTFQVENAPLAYNGRLGNPMGLIGCLFHVDTKGKILDVLRQTTAGGLNWAVHDNTPEPGWRRAQVLRKLVVEAQARSVDAVQKLRIGFTDFHDSRGDRWTDRGTFAFDVGTTNLADIAATLSESHMDVWVDPATMTLKAWRRRGSNKASTVALTLGSGDAGNLMQFESNRRPARVTRYLSQAASGSWVETADTAAEGSAGRIESGLSLGTTGNKSTADEVAGRQLDQLSTPHVFITDSQPTTLLEGAVAGKDYKVGDTITVPGWRGSGTMHARVLSIDVDATGETIVARPGYVEDTTS